MSYARFFRRLHNPIGALAPDALTAAYRKRDEYSPGLEWKAPNPRKELLPRKGTGEPLSPKERQGIVNYDPVVRENHAKQRPRVKPVTPRTQGDVLKYRRGFVEGNNKGFGDLFPESAAHYFCRGCRIPTGRPVCSRCGKKL